MAYYSLSSLIYLSDIGKKTRIGSGVVFENISEDDFDTFKASGAARDATPGEIADAKAAGTFVGKVEDGDGKKGRGRRKGAEGPSKDESKGESKSDDLV